MKKIVEIKDEMNLNLKEIKNIILSKSHRTDTERKSSFISMLWNIRTMNDIKVKKLAEILNFMASNEMGKDNNGVVIDVIAITEFGKLESKFNTFNLKGYNFYSALRNDRKGGGVALYVRNNINVNIKLTKVTKDLEMIHAELFKDDDPKIDLINIYRPPNGNKNVFNGKIDELLFENEDLLVMGDININNFQSEGDEQAKKYLEILSSHNYGMINKAITRFNPITSRHAIIDHIIARTDNSHLFTLTSDQMTINKYSDHNIIFTVHPGNINFKKRVKLLTVNKTNKMKAVEDIKHKIMNIPINENPDILCSTIVDTVKHSLKENTQTFTMKSDEARDVVPPWANVQYIYL